MDLHIKMMIEHCGKDLQAIMNLIADLN